MTRLSALLLLISTLLASTHARADTRVALVIGNSQYASVNALPNPRRDATLVAATLRREGFTVTLVQDATRTTMLDALNAFNDQADRADWALVYYAGHGLEIGGTNYLLPTDARLRTDRDIQDEAVPLERVLGTVEHAKRLRLVILDACRSNVFATPMRRAFAERAVSRGLARPEPQSGIMVVYAAEAGAVADDGIGDHSPFTAALVKRMEEPGLEVSRLFNVVAGDVLNATAQLQRPYEYGSNPGNEEFYFTPPLPVPAPPTREELIWSWLKTTKDVVGLEHFLGGLPPASPLHSEVEAYLSKVKSEEAPAATATAVVASAEPATTEVLGKAPSSSAATSAPTAPPDNSGASGSAVVVAQSAALLVDAPDEPTHIATYPGTVVWHLESVSPGESLPLEAAVKADIDIPAAKLKVTILMQKNPDPRVPASHTIELHFLPQPGNTLGNVKQINVPEMRKDDDAQRGNSLTGVPVAIAENYFLVGLKRGAAESENFRLIKERNWFDISVLFAPNSLGKLTFEKGASGQKVIEEFLRDPNTTSEKIPETLTSPLSMSPAQASAPAVSGDPPPKQTTIPVIVLPAKEGKSQPVTIEFGADGDLYVHSGVSPASLQHPVSIRDLIHHLDSATGDLGTKIWIKLDEKVDEKRFDNLMQVLRAGHYDNVAVITPHEDTVKMASTANPFYVAMAYKALVFGRINRNPEITERAGAQHLKGRMVVAFKIDNAGQVAEIGIRNSSGNTGLNALGLEMIRAAAPFPPPPPGAQRSFTTALTFGE